jgi:NAD(P)-dependent dehydrogenase (short-subunit alcohol dehydrogenase family)
MRRAKEAMMGLLEGKVAMVTGAGRGMGREYALALAREGAAILVNDVGLELQGGVGGSGLETGAPNPAVAQAVVDEIAAGGGRAVADATNVANVAEAASVVAHTLDAFGDIDIAVNNAGVWIHAPIFDTDDERFEMQFNTNVKSVVGGTLAAVNHMRQAGHGGRIINTISGVIHGGAGPEGLGLYIAAMSAVASYTVTTALDGEAFGISANGVGPFGVTRQSIDYFVRTGMLSSTDQATIEHLGPHSNAPLVVYLASELSNGVNGRLFHVAPDSLTIDARIHLSETFIEATEGVTATGRDGWTPHEIATAMSKILHR